MSSFFLDYLNGSDAADGTTFANRWKTLVLGATAARIAPADEIRLMKSPDPTSIGNATWTGSTQNATTPITSSTNATPIVVTRAAHGLSSDDTVIVNGHTTNTKANGVWKVNVLSSSTFQLLNEDGTNSVGNGAGGATGTFRQINNMVVRLASAVTKNIAICGNQGSTGNWTNSSGNVTCAVSTADNKEGGECQSIALAAGFSTGLAAYKATGTLDLSGYKQISFRIKQTAGALGAAGAIQLILSSDVIGATPVDTFDIPAIFALNNWVAFTVDKGSALGSAIASIGFNVITDNGAQTFLIDNVIACLDSTNNASLSLTSLIGKNVAGETFWAVQSINGTRVMLDQNVNARPTTGASILQRGYPGTTEQVQTYKRETIKVAMNTIANLAAASLEFALQDSGTEGSRIVVSGGWDTTNMTTQDGETWLDGQNGFGSGFSASSKSYFTFDKVSAVRYNAECYIVSSHDFSLLGTHLNGGTTRGFYSNQNCNVTLDIKSVSYNLIDGFSGQLDGCTGTVALCDSNNGTSVPGFIVFGMNWDVSFGKVRNNGGPGLQFDLGAFGAVIRNLSTAFNAVSGVAATTGNQVLNSSGPNYLIDASIAEPVEVLCGAYGDGRVWSKNHDGVADNDLGFTDGAMFAKQTAVRHTASDFAWRIDVTDARRTATYPVLFKIADVLVFANKLATVKLWMQRSNTGLTHSLLCKGGQIAGVASDVRTAMTAAANTWEEVNITFTPTEDGWVEINSESYGGTSFSGYVDDLSAISA